jgi:hypothetical protein
MFWLIRFGSEINYVFHANTLPIHLFYVFQNMCDLLSGAGGRAQPQGASVRVPGLASEGLPFIFAKVCLLLSRRFASLISRRFACYFFEGLPLTFAKVCLFLSRRFASYFREGLPITFAKVFLLLSRRFASFIVWTGSALRLIVCSKFCIKRNLWEKSYPYASHFLRVLITVFAVCVENMVFIKFFYW